MVPRQIKVNQDGNRTHLGHSMADVCTFVPLCIYPDIHSSHMLCTEDPDNLGIMSCGSLKDRYL